jgi:hypothetical protein
MKIEYHHDAVRELIEAARYYEGQQPQLGNRFLDSVEQALFFLKQNPLIWPPRYSWSKKTTRQTIPLYRYL